MTFKDEFIIKYAPVNKNGLARYTPTQLKNLLRAAQNCDAQAINALCRAFEPLIVKEARRAYITAILGEDAVNIAWQIFLEFIHGYKGNNYRLLPGLIQKRVHFMLLQKIVRSTSVTASVSLDDENETALTAYVDGNDEHIAKLENKQLLQQALAQLTPKQRQTLTATFIHGYTLLEYSVMQGISFKTAYLHQQRALKKLRESYGASFAPGIAKQL